MVAADASSWFPSRSQTSEASAASPTFLEELAKVRLKVLKVPDGVNEAGSAELLAPSQGPEPPDTNSTIQQRVSNSSGEEASVDRADGDKRPSSETVNANTSSERGRPTRRTIRRPTCRPPPPPSSNTRSAAPAHTSFKPPPPVSPKPLYVSKSFHASTTESSHSAQRPNLESRSQSTPVRNFLKFFKGHAHGGACGRSRNIYSPSKDDMYDSGRQEPQKYSSEDSSFESTDGSEEARTSIPDDAGGATGGLNDRAERDGPLYDEPHCCDDPKRCRRYRGGPKLETPVLGSYDIPDKAEGVIVGSPISTLVRTKKSSDSQISESSVTDDGNSFRQKHSRSSRRAPAANAGQPTSPKVKHTAEKLTKGANGQETEAGKTYPESSAEPLAVQITSSAGTTEHAVRRLPGSPLPPLPCTASSPLGSSTPGQQESDHVFSYDSPTNSPRRRFPLVRQQSVDYKETAAATDDFHIRSTDSILGLSPDAWEEPEYAEIPPMVPDRSLPPVRQQQRSRKSPKKSGQDGHEIRSKFFGRMFGHLKKNLTSPPRGRGTSFSSSSPSSSSGQQTTDSDTEEQVYVPMAPLI